MKRINKKLIMAIPVVLAVICTVVIFSFSMRGGTASHSESGFVRHLLEAAARRLNLHARGLYFLFSPFVENKDHITAEDFVRKLAHFTEYFLLGAVCFVIACLLRRRKEPQRKKWLFILPLLCGPVVSFIDERIIQLCLVTGRTSSYLDMLLDCIGFYTAVLLSAAFFIIIKAIRRVYRKHRHA